VDADDRVVLIGGAAQHAIELGLAHPLVDRAHLLGAVGERSLVVLGRGELEVLERVVDLAPELLREIELRLGVRALAQRGLSLVLVVPESRRERRLRQLVQQSLEFGDVKDAPLAPHSAF
jgi:predicted transcriptional regulator